LSVEELTEKLIGLGLATTKEFVSKLLQVIDNQADLLTLKAFLRAFEYDKIGSLACVQIRQEFNDTKLKAYE